MTMKRALAVEPGSEPVIEDMSEEEIAAFEAGRAIDLAALKLRLKTDIDGAAERQRLKYITPGDGQALVYEAKRTEVTRWRGFGEPSDPDPEDFPWASARAARLETTVLEVLQEWAAVTDQWAAIGIAIEGAREAAKEAIDAAETAAAAEWVVGATAWPSP